MRNHEAEFPGTDEMMAFEAFNVNPPPKPEQATAQLAKLASTFQVSAPDLIAQYQDFQRFALIVHQQNGNQDAFECWRASVQKVCTRNDRMALHPCSALLPVLIRLGAFRPRLRARHSKTRNFNVSGLDSRWGLHIGCREELQPLSRCVIQGARKHE